MVPAEVEGILRLRVRQRRDEGCGRDTHEWSEWVRHPINWWRHSQYLYDSIKVRYILLCITAIMQIMEVQCQRDVISELGEFWMASLIGSLSLTVASIQLNWLCASALSDFMKGVATITGNQIPDMLQSKNIANFLFTHVCIQTCRCTLIVRYGFR